VRRRPDSRAATKPPTTAAISMLRVCHAAAPIVIARGLSAPGSTIDTPTAKPASVSSNMTEMPTASDAKTAGHAPTKIHTTAKVTFGQVPGGFAITGIALTTEGQVPGIDEAAFKKAAEGAKTGCPVSKALASVPITLEAKFIK